MLDGISSLRGAAEGRFGLTAFARVCRPDPFLEVPQDFTRERFCFATGSKLPGEPCCTAQARYSSHLEETWATPANRSRTDAFDVYSLPLKTFFVLVVVVIGVLLVIWRKLLEAKYALIAPAIERAMLIGAVSMLPWPFMDYAYVQAMQTLSGRWSVAPHFRLSLVIAPWALLLLIFFLGRMSRKIERLGQLAGAVVREETFRGAEKSRAGRVLRGCRHRPMARRVDLNAVFVAALMQAERRDRGAGVGVPDGRDVHCLVSSELEFSRDGI